MIRSPVRHPFNAFLNVLREPLVRPVPRFGASAALLLLPGLFLAGCSGKSKDLRGDCRDRFEKIHERYEKGRYASVKQGYGDFLVTCTGTEHVEQAHFELADSHYRLKEWLEAEQEFSAFLRDYPASRRYAETASWLLARSMAEQVHIPQRDQTKTLDALRELETFLAGYPGSERSDSAEAEIERLGQLLAERDMLVARLYSRMGEPLAAAIYYKHLLSEYGDRIPRREINLKLAESYVKLNQFLEAEEILARFDGVARDDPFADEIADVRRKLDKAKARYEREKRKEQRQSAP